MSSSRQEQPQKVQEPAHGEDDDEEKPEDGQPPQTHENLENVQEPGHGEDGDEEKPKDGVDVSDQAILQEQPQEAEKRPLLHIGNDGGQPRKQIKLGAAPTKFDKIKSHAYLNALVNDRVYQEKFDDAIIGYDYTTQESPFMDEINMKEFISTYLGQTGITTVNDA